MSNSSFITQHLSTPEVHGHRGCRGLFPENTLPAFEHAVALGVDVLELDVVVSADGQVVVSHEPWFSAAICRYPDGRPIRSEQERQLNLYQLSYAEIRQYDCGSTQHPRFPRQQLRPAHKPLLSEVIRHVETWTTQLGRAAMRYSIEVKTEPGGDDIFHPRPEIFVSLVLSVLGQERVLERATLLSFDHRILQVARQLAPPIPRCLLVEDDRSLDAHLAELGFVPEVFGPDFQLLTASLFQQATALGMRVVPWTVNDEPVMQRLLDMGVAGITTDYPEVLLAVVAGRR